MPTSQETRVQAGTTDRGTVLCAPANCERNRPVVTIRGRQGSIGIAMIRQPSPAVVDAVFHMHEITKIYRMGDVTVEALRGITLDLLPGEFVVMLGPSGSGKSTLLNILGGLDVPTSGEVHYRDHNLTAATREELTRFRREHVGFVFQFYNLIPSLTALENTALVSEISENPLDPEECLRMVGLGDRVIRISSGMIAEIQKNERRVSPAELAW
jgi:ABC-type sugar transport system ATPase subunit